MRKTFLKIMTIATLATATLSPMTTQADTVTNKSVVNQYIEESFMSEADYSTIFIKSENLTKKMLRRRKKTELYTWKKSHQFRAEHMAVHLTENISDIISEHVQERKLIAFWCIIRKVDC